MISKPCAARVRRPSSSSIFSSAMSFWRSVADDTRTPAPPSTGAASVRPAVPVVPASMRYASPEGQPCSIFISIVRLLF